MDEVQVTISATPLPDQLIRKSVSFITKDLNL